MMASKDEKVLGNEGSRPLPTTDSPSKQNALESQIDPMDKFAQAKAEGVKPAFLAKVSVLNQAIAEIGMGRFQWELFFTAGECLVIFPPSDADGCKVSDGLPITSLCLSYLL